MVDYLEELDFGGVSAHLKKQIQLIMYKERETRIEENETIRIVVDDFFHYCSSSTPGSSMLVKFHELMMVMMREMQLDDFIVSKFCDWMLKADVRTLENCRPIQNLFDFVRGVKYVERRVDDRGGVLEAGSRSQENEEP